MSARIPDSTLRSCDHPGCETTFDAAAPDDNWIQLPSRNEHYCPVHHDSPVPAAARRLTERHGIAPLAKLAEKPEPWEYDDIRDFLIYCPTPSILWRRALREALRVMNEEISDAVVFDFLNPDERDAP